MLIHIVRGMECAEILCVCWVTRDSRIIQIHIAVIIIGTAIVLRRRALFAITVYSFVLNQISQILHCGVSLNLWFAFTVAVFPRIVHVVVFCEQLVVSVCIYRHTGSNTRSGRSHSSSYTTSDTKTDTESYTTSHSGAN